MSHSPVQRQGAPPRAPLPLSLTDARENAEGIEMDRNTSLINNLEAHRRTLGWSLYELGGRCGIDGTFLSDWEHGLGSPRFDEIQQWAAALGLTFELVPTGGECR